MAPSEPPRDPPLRGAAPPTVPAPAAPGDPDAWYAPGVREQTEVHPCVVATIRETTNGFAYETREPSLAPVEAEQLDAVREHFVGAHLRRPRTREGTAERVRDGFAPKHRAAVDSLVDASPAGRRRIDYYAVRDVRCLGDLTPLALDSRIEVADVAADRLVVHTDDFAPATTTIPADADYLDRFASERLDTYTVDFQSFSVPVVLYRENLLGTDAFETKYAVREPDLLPGDRELVEECKERIWEANVEEVVDDRAAFVRSRAEAILSRLLTARNTRAWLDATRHRLQDALATYGGAVQPVDARYSADRLDDLVYYVLRDFVGHGQLTVPIRDPNLEDIEANRVGERVKVVPRSSQGHAGRVPTNLAFEDEQAFVNVVTQLAASDGVELNAANPSAKVNLDPDGVEEDVTIRCAVALPVISEGGPHISIRKQAADAMTPVDLVEGDSLSTELVALLWLCYEHHAVVLFSGPTGVGKTTLMNACLPFVQFDDRPISIDEGSREVRIPHETGISLTTRDHENDHKRVSMADLMTEANYLNPDVEVIAEINTPASFETFAESIATGHGVIGTTHAEDVEKLVNRIIEQGLPAYMLRELDLVVFPRHVDGERYVGRAIEFVTEAQYADCTGERGEIRKDGTTIHWNEVSRRRPDGSFERDEDPAVFERIATRTDRPVDAVRDEFDRKHRYVRYLVNEGVSDFEDLFEFLSDLRLDEAATVERLHRDRVAPDHADLDVGGVFVDGEVSEGDD